MAVCQLKYHLLLDFFSLLYSASGVQTAQRVPVLAVQSAVHLNTTAGSTRERSSSPATARRQAVRPPIAPSAPLLENACGLANLSAQVPAIKLKSLEETVNFHSFLKKMSLYNRW